MVDWSEESALHPGGFRIGRGGSQGALPAIAAIPTASSAFPARTGRVPPEVLQRERGETFILLGHFSKDKEGQFILRCTRVRNR